MNGHVFTRASVYTVSKRVGIIFFLLFFFALSGATSVKAANLASSTFTLGDEGWVVVDWDGSDTPYVPSWQSTGGIPGGYLACPLDVQSDGFFRAPNAFHGNMSAAYGGSLSYDLFAIIPDPWVMSDIYITGGGQTITYRHENQPTGNWQHFTAPLSDGKGWMFGMMYDTTGPAATANQITAVLADVTDIRIRQEYAWGPDSSGIDNVVLAGPAATPRGDINHDGGVDLADAILSLQVVSEIPSTAAIYKDADVNGDGKIGLAETIYILQMAAGLRPVVMAPNAPTDVSAVAGNGQVTLSWTAVVGATSYNVYYRTAAGVTIANGTKLTGLISGSAITGLTNGATYYFIITALNGGLESVPSAEVVSTPNVAPAASVKWSYQLSVGTGWQSGISVSPALGTDGTIYIGNNLDAKVVAMNPDGTKKWEFLTAPKLTDSVNLTRPLTVGADGTIYISSGNTKMFAINPDGSQKWVQTFADSYWGMSSGIAVSYDGATVYGVGQAGKLYAVQSSDGAKLWEFATGGAVGDMYSTPIVGKDGTIYFGGGYGSANKQLHAINPDGTQKWAFLTGGTITASPSIGTDGTVYIGSQDGYLYAVNPDGTQKWRYSVGTVQNSSAAIDGDGNVYFGGYAGGVSSFDSTGNLRWTFTTTGGVDITPLIGNDGNIHVVTLTGYVYCLNQAGAKQWELNVTGGIPSSPVMDAGGVLYFGNYDGKIYAVQTTATGIDASAQWPMFGGDVKHSGRQKVINTPPADYLINDNFDALNTSNWWLARGSNNDHFGEGKSFDASGVTFADGIATLNADQTDQVGVMYSKPLAVNRGDIVRIKRKAYVHAADRYYGGALNVYEVSDPALSASKTNTFSPLLGVMYYNFTYQTDLNLFSLIWAGNLPNGLGDFSGGTAPQIAPLWDQWFEEEIIYNSGTGETVYKIDGLEKMRIQASPLSQPYIKIMMHSYGWYTGHYIKMDYITVETKTAQVDTNSRPPY